ncbi:hypothetical protein BHAP_2178 [Bifidobacterium hapali]|uniref:Uncharacterized protein n=1 Tax=Bifidobacterium hapali TaxID=1630172 RepID=A0A261FSF2_9BIFI|nr:hypothetical protein BHAP_2178 [Bifidobacterium hapali]
MKSKVAFIASVAAVLLAITRVESKSVSKVSTPCFA